MDDMTTATRERFEDALQDNGIMARDVDTVIALIVDAITETRGIASTRITNERDARNNTQWEEDAFNTSHDIVLDTDVDRVVQCMIANMTARTPDMPVSAFDDATGAPLCSWCRDDIVGDTNATHCTCDGDTKRCDRCGERVNVDRCEGAEIVNTSGDVLFVHADSCMRDGDTIA